MPNSMKQSKDLVASFNTDELEVAEILGQFSELVIQHEYRDRVPLWGCKKARYALPSTLSFPSSPTSSSSCDNLPINEDHLSLQPLHSNIKTMNEVQLLKLVEKLTGCRADIQKAMENVEAYNASLKDLNKKLKDRRSEYSSRTGNHRDE